MALTRKQIRESGAKALGVYVDLGSPASNSANGLVGTFNKVADLAVDNEKFRWSYLYNSTDAEFRLVTNTVASNGLTTVQRAFTNSILTTKSYQLYGILSPDEWNDIIDEEALPNLYYRDRFTITLIAGTTEYNATNTASWLTTVEQIIRIRFKNDQDANAPAYAEAPVVYPYQGGDGVVTISIPSFNDVDKLLVEGRHYYTALGNETNTVAGPPKLFTTKAKHEALQRIFHTMGPAAKKIFGQQMVLVERNLAEVEKRFQSHTVMRDYWSEDEPLAGDPFGTPNWTW